MNDRVQIPEIIRVIVQGPPGPAGAASLRGPFPFDNIPISEDGLLLVVPDTPEIGDGTQNIAIGNHALANTTTGNITVAIGTFAGQSFGTRAALLTNGDFASGANWTLGAGWTIAGGKASHAAGSASSISQAIAVQGGIPYEVNYTISGYVQGTLQAIMSGGGMTANGALRDANATYSEFLRARDGNTTIEFAASADFIGSLDNVEVNTLGGRSSVFVGHVAGQYSGNAASNTFIGAFCGQGQEFSEVDGSEISGQHLQGGGNNCGLGEACLIHIRGGAQGNCAYGFNAGFWTTTGSNNVCLGISAGANLTDVDSDVCLGQQAYRYGRGANNMMIGPQAGYGNVQQTPLVGSVLPGDHSFDVVDSSIFVIGGHASNDTFLFPDAIVTAIAGNTVTVDKPAWGAQDDSGAQIFVSSIVNPHTGFDNVGIGRIALLNMAGDAKRNTAIGVQAGQNISTGNNNTLIGRLAGTTLTTGSTNIMIGTTADATSAAANNTLNIGNCIFGTGIDAATSPTAGRIGIRTNAPSGALDINDDHLRVRTAKTPATAAAAGNAGDIAWDANFVYVCVATNTWKRSALATW